MLPLFLVVPAAAAAVFGVGKTIKAVLSSEEADKINISAKDLIEVSKQELETVKEECSNALELLGKEKAYVLDTSVTDFISEFEKLKNVNFKDSTGLNELNNFINDKQNFKEIKEISILASSLIQGVGGGAVAGGIVAFGAYSAVAAFGTASTGTAIASLGGTVATKATLAFLGGGAISVGGAGVAGGMMMLGALVAAPALLTIGIVSDSKANAKLDEAKSNLAEAKVIAGELQNMQIMTRAIASRADMFRRLLIKLDSYLAPLVYDMSNIIEKNGVDFSKYNETEQSVFAKAVSMVKAIKTVLDTPIIGDKGEASEESLATYNKINAQL